MPLNLPPELQKVYSTIVASLTKHFESKGMDKHKANTLAKEKADAAIQKRKERGR